MSEPGLVVLDKGCDGVVTIELRDPAGKNALSPRLVDELSGALEAAVEWDELKVVVLLGQPDVFCAGASREVLTALADGAIAPHDLVLTRAVLELPVPTIAAMEGHAIGGGLALGVAADLVLISRESRYGCSFMNMGFTPGMGVTRLLEHVLSPALAHEMLYGGEPMKGTRFEGRSGFNYVLPRSEVRPKALELAARIAEKPRLALRALKQTLALPKRQAYEVARVAEAQMHEVTFSQAGIRRMIEDSYVE